MGYLNSLSLLKRSLLGFNINDKTLGNALEALKNLEIDEMSSNALQIIFNKVVVSSKDLGKSESEKQASAYKPEPQKFENASTLQMKYEDLKKSSEQEVQRLNNHIKALMQKLDDFKDAKRGEKSQKYACVDGKGSPRHSRRRTR